MPAHTDKHYEAELKELKDEILKMGGVVEEMIQRSMKALVDRNSNLAEEVIKRDPEVNRLEMEIDAHCVQLLALHQPAASDLRFITVGLKISKDLERMGDLAVNVCQDCLDLNREPQLKPYIHLPQMATKAQKMVKDSLDCFVKQDAALARKVCEADDEVDRLKDDIYEEVISFMKKDPEVIVRGTHLIAVAKHLERVADHATNIAEVVIFMITGEDIRHRNLIPIQIH